MWSLFLLLVVSAFGRIALVEEHNHVLVHIMNATKHGLPSEGVTLIHFDSHADMSVPGYFPPSIMNTFTEHPEDIISATQINNWVTATWLLGTVSTMIFIEPPWGCEFRMLPYKELVYYAGTVDGQFKVDVYTKFGKRVHESYVHTVDDQVLDDPMNHFAPHEEMQNKKKIEVLILPFEKLFTTLVSYVQKKPLASLILDIDLDCFSTESPAHLHFYQDYHVPLRYQQLAADIYNARLPPFKTVSAFSVEWWRQNLEGWRAHCPNLFAIFSEAQKRQKDGKPSESAAIFAHEVPLTVLEVDPNGVIAQLYDMTGLEGQGDDSDLTRAYIVGLFQAFTANFESLIENEGMDGASEILSHVLTMPLHLGTIDEINVMIGAIECVLTELTAKGRSLSLITLARSPMYTPIHNLRHIECTVFEMISRQFPEMTNVYHEVGLHADYSACNLGFRFREIGSLVPNNFTQERTDRAVGAPVEIIVANTSPELILMNWQNSEGDWEEQIRVAPYSYDGENWLTHHGHVLAASTQDGFIIAEMEVNAELGHTQLWTISTGAVDAVLKTNSATRHRDM